MLFFLARVGRGVVPSYCLLEGVFVRTDRVTPVVSPRAGGEVFVPEVVALVETGGMEGGWAASPV